MNPALAGALVGLLGGGGLALVVLRMPVLRRPTLDDRLAPYLRDTPRVSRLLADAHVLTPFPTLERIAGPLIRDAAHRLERLLGGTASVRRRLDQLGDGTTVEQFRAQQVLWGSGGLAGALALSLVLLSDGRGSPAPLLVLCGLATVGGVLARDYALGAAVRRREQRMVAEFPTIAELLALSVSAGEGASGALERVCALGGGELSRELGRALADARAGASLVVALEGIAERTSLAALARFADGVAVAVDRGTPLADVLRAQATDVREMGRRALLEAGGRKEIAMMVPVVFLVLPVTVAFALFPGLITLHLAG
ncbi:tight adherence protein C [Motilibacter rhizosphaerae]|uniref:Tight adherence protein C n=1 Tax=Motilibacter rhizosphaerae TaxID=598652 RepID=A0A4Q7NTE0_9ACTN|nr:type II secretion system F family protein [Motilibacter rhizosphaerae]RZS90068.1 tight adherence protein C [Motilibacter rhizosphaerae]